MKESKTPLSKLLVEEEDEQLLTELLEPYVRIVRSTGKCVFEERYWKLSQNGKIAVVVLAQRALARLTGGSRKIKPKIIIECTGISRGTVLPTLRTLEEKKGLLKSEKGEYFVPSFYLHKLKDFLKKEEKPK